jgi:magnesium transporter
MPTAKELIEFILLHSEHVRVGELAEPQAADVAETLDRFRQIEALHPADIAEALNHRRLVEAADVIQVLPTDLAVTVCNQAMLRRRAALFDHFEPAHAARLLERLSADQRREIISHMNVHQRHQLVPKLSPSVRAEAEQLLQYPDRTAGGIMTTEFVRLDPHMTVGQALKHIRSVARESESIYACYIVEPGTDKLLGTVSLRDLVMGEFAQPITDVMRKHPIAVHALDPSEVVTRIISKYNLLAVPVLEQGDRVVGFVTVDDVLDAVVEKANEEMQRMGGVAVIEESYMEANFLTVWRKRVGWLALLFGAELLTFTAMAHFEDALAKVVVLGLFVPLCISTGGNSGSQAATLIMCAMAAGHVRLRDWARVLGRELVMGVALGLSLGAIAFLRGALTPDELLRGEVTWWQLALTVTQAVAMICMWGTLIGSMLPLLFRRMGFDPAFASSPFVATFVDVTGIIFFFTSATIWIPMVSAGVTS